MDDQTRTPRILLIMRDPPNSEANKGGLFPTAIKQHVDLGFDVYVASMSWMSQRHKEVVRRLGATPVVPPQDFFRFFQKEMISSIVKRRRPKGPDLTSPNCLSWIGKEISPDIITGMQSYHTGLIAQKIGKALNVPYVIWEHIGRYKGSDAFSVPDEAMSKLFLEAHTVLAVSSSLCDAISHRFPVASGKTKILPNPIPLNFTDQATPPMPDWLEEACRSRFLFASWTSWREMKRLDLLLDAFLALHKNGYIATVIIAGQIKGDAVEVANQFLLENPIMSNSVIFTGGVDRASIHHLAAKANCCVIPSDSETFGLSMIEALSLGTPVVSTRCGGPEEYLEDSRLGLLCERGSVDALCAAMMHVMDKYEVYQPEEIAQIADELLGDAAIKRKWAAVYKDIVPSIVNEL